MNMNNINEQVVHEECVSCNKMTEVLTTEPVYNRMYYVEGAGQLCGECYTKIYT